MISPPGGKNMQVINMSDYLGSSFIPINHGQNCIEFT